MEHLKIGRAILPLLWCLCAAACMDLEVTNLNQPDQERALADPGDVESLISATYNTWFATTYASTGYYATPGFFLSNQAFQHVCPWDNFGMESLSRIPRNAYNNDVNFVRYGYQASLWVGSYQAISALANGLKAIEAADVAEALGPEEVQQLTAYGKFVQGLAHGTVALAYDQGVVLDETTDVTETLPFVGYHELMDSALAYLDEAIQLATESDFTIPPDWMSVEVTNQEVIQLAHSYKARLRAQVARTREERATVDWNAVLADVDGGVQEDWNLHMDWNQGWYNGMLDYGPYPGWHALAYFMYGMADQSGNVAEWYTLPLLDKQAILPDGRPVLIETPDLRFPQGSTVEEQRANEGQYFRVFAEDESSLFQAPHRGTWRWSWYRMGMKAGMDYDFQFNWHQPEITRAEMRLLKAEGLYRTGDLAGAAAIVNETRTLHGLSPTDASGANASCVPRLPNGECGDLWEMLKWEKRMETLWTGVAGVNWFFDGRGWGDLFRDTPLQLPLPCQEIEALQMGSCYTFGGAGGEMSAPVSTYRFPSEFSSEG